MNLSTDPGGQEETRPGQGIFLDGSGAVQYNPIFCFGAEVAKESFEKDLERLETIVSRLEGEEVSLDESMKLFEEGVKLSRRCSKKLDEAETKVSILVRDEKGGITTEPFDPGE